MIDKIKLKHPLPMLCHQLNVAVSGYFAYCSGKPVSPRRQEDLRLLTHIRAAHTHGRGIYGVNKIQSELAALSIQVGVNRMKRLSSNAVFRGALKLKITI